MLSLKASVQAMQGRRRLYLCLYRLAGRFATAFSAFSRGTRIFATTYRISTRKIFGLPYVSTQVLLELPA